MIKKELEQKVAELEKEVEHLKRLATGYVESNAILNGKLTKMRNERKIPTSKEK